MKILGIGNAIIDVICKVDDNFLVQNKLTKSNMKLVDENEFNQLILNLKIEKTIAGGSVANSIVGLSQLKNDVSFIGKVNDDKFGNDYEKSLSDEKVKYCYKKKLEKTATGTCLILITPDSERTMCTFLGIAGKITPNDINDAYLKENDLIFLEGYLLDEGEPKAAFEKAISLAKKSILSLSDKFCVERHKKIFFDLVKNKIDVTFANEQEILELINANSFNDVVEFGKKLNKLLVITRSDKGSIAIKGNEVFECKSKKDLKIVDLTGAGDLFAGGFLHSYINEQNVSKCLQKGTEMASKIIQKIGARLE